MSPRIVLSTYLRPVSCFPESEIERPFLPIHLAEPVCSSRFFFRKILRKQFNCFPVRLNLLKNRISPGPHEILIIDDGSPTPIETAAALIGSDDILTERFEFIRVSRNNGLVNALNIGLVESCFPFIARINADDRWLPTKIEKQFLLFDTDPDLSITATGMHLVTLAGESFETHIRPGDWNENPPLFHRRRLPVSAREHSRPP